MNSKYILLLGVGQLAKSFIPPAFAAGYTEIVGTTRNPNRIFEFIELGLKPVIMPLPSAEIVETLTANATILVSFPPDGESDKIIAPACKNANKIIYISSTSVYGKETGIIDETTPCDYTDKHALKRLEAEDIWLNNGAIVLRAPGLYGNNYGLHKRLNAGTYRISGDGLNYISRIHLTDLANIILKIIDNPNKLSTNIYLLGDKKPSTQIEVIEWLCAHMNISLPESIPLKEAHNTLRGNRQINGHKILKELNYDLKFPDFQSGYTEILNSKMIEE